MTTNIPQSSDPDFLKKLPRYKTARSPVYDCYVGIDSVRYDDDGEPIITGHLGIAPDIPMLFRPWELEHYCL